MDSPVASPISDPAFIAALPGWTLPRGHEPNALAVATTAGIALKALDDTSTPLHSTPVWRGCWRSRPALKCAAAAVQLIGRTEDETALRDAALLTAAGDDPGPAGKVFLA